MRQRTTFFHRPENPVDPALLRLADATLAGPTIDAAREDRVTLGLDELPAGLAYFLAADVQELHVRWAAATAAAEPVSPLLSRLSPGLHVFYTPHAGASEKRDAVCSLPRHVFGLNLDCESMPTSSNYLGDGRLSQSAAFQFYSPVDHLPTFAEYIQADLCPFSGGGGFCALGADRLDGASSLDLSYDSVSRSLKVTTRWPLAERPLFVDAKPGSRTEVGIMAADAPPTLGPHEIGMSGHVAVLDQDDHPKPVMFSFPSRHRQAAGGASFSAAFLQPTGLHPTLQLRLAPGPPPRDDDSCKLHTYLILPRHIFADKYQLGDELFLASKNLTALRHITQPVDLEAPIYAVSVWGSAALIELAAPAGQTQRQQQQQSAWTAEVPLHLRYLQPAEGGYRFADVPYPTVFWACEADKDIQFSSNPFDRANIGYDGLFDSTTEFWHVTPDPRMGASPPADTAASPSKLFIPIRVPVLDSKKTQWVNVGTSAAILLGFSWVLWKLFSVYLRTGYGQASPKDAIKPLKKTQ